jgi:AraC-like DNA-binding protein
MAITVSRADYDELWNECNPDPLVSSRPGYAESMKVVPQQLGQGFIRWIQLREINVTIFNYQLHHDLFVSDEVFGAAWEIGFNLSGNRSGKRTGENFIEWGACEDAGTWITYANDPVLKVDIHLNAPDALCQVISETLEELPIEIREYIENDDGKRFDEINCITPAMRSTLEKILFCPSAGKIGQIYLESYCLELIALKLEQLADLEQYPRKLLRSLNSDDIDRIYLAKKIIANRADDPPSLMELARQVGLNDFKLKTGFRQVFGTTVFGFLHHHRMETARQLLSDRRMNVREVAQAVGYTNQSHFASAFRKQFGVNPKSYLLHKKSV